MTRSIGTCNTVMAPRQHHGFSIADAIGFTLPGASSHSGGWMRGIRAWLRECGETHCSDLIWRRPPAIALG